MTYYISFGTGETSHSSVTFRSHESWQTVATWQARLSLETWFSVLTSARQSAIPFLTVKTVSTGRATGTTDSRHSRLTFLPFLRNTTCLTFAPLIEINHELPSHVTRTRESFRSIDLLRLLLKSEVLSALDSSDVKNLLAIPVDLDHL